MNVIDEKYDILADLPNKIRLEFDRLLFNIVMEKVRELTGHKMNESEVTDLSHEDDSFNSEIEDDKRVFYDNMGIKNLMHDHHKNHS